MYICLNCFYKGDMESVEGIPRCPDCGQDDTQDYLEYLIDKAEYQAGDKILQEVQ